LSKLIQIVIQGRHGTHVFQNLQALKWSFLKATADFRSRDSFNFSASKYLFQQLQTCSFDRRWLYKVEDPQYYRRIGPDRDPLDTAGSLSDGGRHNIGGAQASTQVTSIFKPIGSKRSALYVSEDPISVRKEFGDEAVPGSKAITYTIGLKRRKALIVIDASQALDDLSRTIPDIVTTVGTASMNGKWGDLKQPAPCQIFGHWLICHAPKKTDGIRFLSSHDEMAWNVCLFFADTRACKKALKASPAVQGD